MTMLIHDSELDALAEEVRRATKAEAVRQALQAQLSGALMAAPLSARLAHTKALADAMGQSDPLFDQKAHYDRMWREP